MRPTVNTEKHFKQDSLFTLASGAISNRNIAVAVVAPAGGNTDVRVGCTISAVYCEMWLTSDDTAQGSVICTLEKVPGNAADMSVGNAAALHSYANKKNILHTQMGLLGPNTQYPMAVVKGWFKIPKGKQRFGLGDQLHFNIFAQSNGVQGCGFFLFKEQY